MVPLRCGSRYIPQIPLEPACDRDQEPLEVKESHEFAGDLSLGEFGRDELVHVAGVRDVAREDGGGRGESSSDNLAKVKVGQLEFYSVSLRIPGHACYSHIAVLRYLGGRG